MVLDAFFISFPIAVGAAAEKAFTGEPALDDQNPVRAMLIADVAVARVGEKFHVGAAFDLAPGWHIYWIFPGNTGRPTQVDFSFDEGIVAGQSRATQRRRCPKATVLTSSASDIQDRF